MYDKALFSEMKQPFTLQTTIILLQAIESAQAAQDMKIRFDSFQQQFQEVCLLLR